ncbi:MAG: flap endonuclease-1 [Candidatus Thermoplasmatota archaeon]|nr:flap endonuclease-1 [Candidatus Thermoplasmatota archaeon]
MGVDIGELVIKERKTLGAFKNKVIAIDAYNALYQFLSIIRQPDGTPLKDSHGRVTSHLSGLFYRTSNLVEHGIKPVYVFDGVPSKLKFQTIEGRADLREKAALEWKEALERGDLETARIKAMQSSKLTKELVEDSKLLLKALGIPYINAPSEGEAQASYMAGKKDVYCTASQDFDSLLFGAPKLIRNLTITGRRKLPRKNIYIEIEPEEIDSAKTLESLELTREQLVDIGILVGTDFNLGIKGIGAKKALKLIKEHSNLENVLRVLGERIEHYDLIRAIFLNPEVTDNYKLIWREADHKAVKELLCKEHNFSIERVEKALQKFNIQEKRTQKIVEDWF